MDINNKIYEYVQNFGSCLSATVISGEYTGSRMIAFDNKTEYFGDAGRAFWDGLENIKTTDLCKIKGCTVLFKYFSGHPKLYIFGGGHVGQKLCAIGAMCGFSVTVVDDREEYVSEKLFEAAEKRICCNFDTVFDSFDFADDGYFAVLTRGHLWDQVCIEKILKHQAAYTGMIGSHKKVAESIKILREKGFSDEEISRLNAPIGLKIGAKTPAEIAVSITAQMIEVKNGRRKSILDASLFEQEHTDYVLMTVADKEGSSPAEKGAMMLVFADKSKGTLGTVGGGNGEFTAVKKTYEKLEQKQDFIVDEFNMDGASSNTKMVCGGRIRIVFERFCKSEY